ncbi:hypothetical protein DTO012A8_8445 [Penicillium roqueforti]|nr:hypothetical protein DTO012A8_8445 [Penicillium roqueforti]
MPPKKKGDGKGGPKPGTKQAKAVAEKAADEVKKQVPEEPKKPSVKDVIGGASWTGKLPVNMLAEHCQKQKWEKPEYNMIKTADGFVSSVTMKKIDPKTKELIVIPPIKLPPSHKQLAGQPTALEARHFAAAFALFRVCNMRNIHMMMPPTYKKLWKEDFGEIKAAETREGKGWMYEADPFLAKQERESAAADLAKKRADRERAQAKEKASNAELGLGNGDARSKRIWSQAPKVDMGTRIRRDIEGLLRQHTVWNPYGVKIPETEKKTIADEFTGLGFRRSHVEEATAECKDREEVLEWLLIYVPDDDLPRWSLPEGYSAGVSLGSGDLAREGKVKRLASVGYPADMCSQILDRKHGDELAAAEHLQGTLTHGTQFSAPSVADEDEEAWAEEATTLEAIFGERYHRISARICEINSEASDIPQNTIFRFQKPSAHYPTTPPVISIQAKGVPAYIRLSAIRRAVQYAEENFTGESMIFNIMDWLEVNLPSIMENPGKLREISAVTASSVAETHQIPVRSSRKNRRGIDWKIDSERSLAIRDAWEAKQDTAPQIEMNRKRKALPAWNIQHEIIHSINSNQVTIISGETGSDFLLALLRDVLNYRKDLKVILMSATLDAGIFMRYFGSQRSVGLVNIPGRTFPVEDYYLDDVIRYTSFAPELAEGYEDEEEPPRGEETLGKALRSLGMGINYDLIAATVEYIDSQLGNQPGGILIFLPGTLEIDRCLKAVSRIPDMHPLPLHASLLPAEQRRVFQSAPRGKRKVIAATNVAETSITIEDVVAVIDTGRVKETSYDPKDNMVRLQEVWASQAACKQRRGRAGRVRAGICYKLYTRKAEANMAQRPDPEIRRVPLEQLCLSVKSMKGIDDVATFLANTITPPESIAVEGALSFLHRVGALDHDRLTALGRYLSMIPADLRCAKLMIYGSIFGCMEPCLTIAAMLTVKSPFVSPREKRDEANAAKATFSRPGDGDLLTDLSAYQAWSERTRAQGGYWGTQSWCAANFLSHQTLRDISSNRAQFITSLKDAGVLPIQYSDASASAWNRNATNRNLIRALVAGAFQPQVAQISFPDKKFASSVTGTVEVDPDARTIKYFNQENGRVFIHPSSILFSAAGYPSAAAYLSYFTKMATSKVFIRDLTPFNSYSLLLFCGSIELDTVGRGLVVDGWLRLRGWARIGVLVSRLRTMLDEALTERFDNPSVVSNGSSLADRVIEAVKKLIEFNGLDQ